MYQISCWNVGFTENIPSERELMRRLPERLDWLWFCEFDLDDELPDHSVLSKARQRWGLEVFEEFFRVVLKQCVQAGLVDGQTIHMDSSLIQGDVSADSLEPAFSVLAREKFNQLERACSQTKTSARISTTDPDARCRRKGAQRVIGYHEHRVVDDAYGVITASETTDASISECLMLQDMVQQHIDHIESKSVHVVADKAYGTINNYKYLKNKKILPCIPHKHHTARNTKAYPKSMFKHVEDGDYYVCPAGKMLRRLTKRPNKRGQITYRADTLVCQKCARHFLCFGGLRAKRGKSICHIPGQECVIWADECLSHTIRHRLLGRRKWVMEGSFGDAATHHGFKRSRWRGTMKVNTQGRLIATLQNLRKLMKYGHCWPLPATSVVNRLYLNLFPLSTS